MFWPTVSAVGFVAATALVVALARARTARWERERRQRPAPTPPEPEEPEGRLTRVRRVVEVRAAARVRSTRAVHAGGERVRALRARGHRTDRSGAAEPAAGGGRPLPAVQLGPAGIRLPLPLPDRLRRRRARRAAVEVHAAGEGGAAPVLLPQDAEGPEIPVGDRADPAPQL